MGSEDRFNSGEFSDILDDESTIDEELNCLSKSTKSKKRRMKPRVCSKWSDEDIFKLIKCVESIPMLWDSKDAKYRNKIERQSAWNRISENDFNHKFTDTELMAKWSNVRIQYRSYFVKHQKTRGIDHGANEPIKWKFYEAMGFICSAEEEQSAPIVSNFVNSEEILRDCLGGGVSTSIPNVSKSGRLSQSSSITTNSSAVNIVAEGMKDAVNQLKEQWQKQEDEIDVFGKYIASEIRSLSDPSAAQRVRFKVARFLMDCIECEKQSTSELYGHTSSSVNKNQMESDPLRFEIKVEPGTISENIQQSKALSDEQQKFSTNEIDEELNSRPFQGRNMRKLDKKASQGLLNCIP